MDFSTYQHQIFDAVADPEFGNIMVQARAGSGKTTTTVEAGKRLSPQMRAVFLAFNKSIATTLQDRLPKSVDARTFHSLGLMACTTQFGRLQVNGNNLEFHLKNFAPNQKYLWSTTKRMTSLLKNNNLPCTNENFTDLANYYAIEMNGTQYDVFDLTSHVMLASEAPKGYIDFDDMIWLPVKHNLPVPQFDFVFVDELQDNNPCQNELVAKALRPNGRIMGVGDQAQSIYAFRGADNDSMSKFMQRFNAKTLNLPVTYRNPKSIVRLVNQRFPSLLFECPDTAIEGKIQDLSKTKLIEVVTEGDMVLCRTNAPLVAPAFELIRKGIKAAIKGRDIGEGLKTLVDKIVKRVSPASINDFLDELNQYRQIEIGKLLASEKTAQAQRLEDQVDTIVALSDGCYIVQDLKTRIDTIFSDDIQAVQFSSVHRAKGLEARNVYIIEPQLMPHRLAKKDWEYQQELNLIYVAYTRALETLTFVV